MTNEPHAPVLTVVLDKLLLGRAGLCISKIKNEKSKSKIAEEDLIEAKKWLDEAVDGLRKAGAQEFLVLGLLARAGYYRCQRNWDKAWGDLEEVREIAERGEMKLHLADYHLETTRLCIDEGKKEDAKGHREAARRLIKECGYHRRDEELKDIEGRM